jgi:5'-methylthioadenosine phosphorylase
MEINMNLKPRIAVIGGSGLYQFDDLKDITSIEINTPFGAPSSPITIGLLNQKPIAFLARHGQGHIYSPSEVPYQANIYALKSLGIKYIISVSACGSLRESYAPGHIVIPDQIFDFTHLRKRSFFDSGLVAHVSAAEPFCNQLSSDLEQSIKSTDAAYHRDGTFITIEGPRFSTKGESNLYRQWGLDIIGMTASPEVFLAREAEMCYATMAHVTDYDVWHISEETVTVEMVIKTLLKNVNLAQRIIKKLVDIIDTESDCDCHHALKNAIITNPDQIDKKKQQDLALFIDKYLA